MSGVVHYRKGTAAMADADHRSACHYGCHRDLRDMTYSRCAGFGMMG